MEEAQASVEALEAANEALRESNSQLSHRVKQTVEALKIASGAAAHARADSDASNSKVRGLASQVAELVNAMDETKVSIVG